MEADFRHLLVVCSNYSTQLLLWFGRQSHYLYIVV